MYMLTWLCVFLINYRNLAQEKTQLGFGGIARCLGCMPPANLPPSQLSHRQNNLFIIMHLVSAFR